MKVMAETPITYRVAGGDISHSPMILGRVNGADLLLVLDSGSEVHLLTESVVDRIGLPKHRGEEGTDHGGATMPSWDVGDVSLSLGGAGLRLRNVVAIADPAPFRERGIAGILSPQHLDPSAAAVVDMLNDELLLIEGTDDELAIMLDRRSAGLDQIRLERDPGFPSIVVRAAIEPFAAIPTMLNTGGKRTEFGAAAVPALARSAEPERLGGGVSGADVLGYRVGRQTLVVAGRRIQVESLAVRDTMPEPHGLVGMDVLRGSVLTVAADTDLTVWWQIAPRP